MREFINHNRGRPMKNKIIDLEKTKIHFFFDKTIKIILIFKICEDPFQSLKEMGILYTKYKGDLKYFEICILNCY